MLKKGLNAQDLRSSFTTGFAVFLSFWSPFGQLYAPSIYL